MSGPLFTPAAPDPLDVYERMTPLVAWMRTHGIKRFAIDGIEIELDALPEPITRLGGT